MSNAPQCKHCLSLIQPVTDEIIEDMAVCAFEGGSGYWIELLDLQDSAYWYNEDNKDRKNLNTGGVIRITPEDGEVKELTRAKLEQGIRKAAVHNGQSIEAFYENHDANDADIALQFALFDEVVYG